VLPSTAQDRIFLAYPWTFLGEYELPKMILDTPVRGLSAITYDDGAITFTPSPMIAANSLLPVLYPQVNYSTDSEKIGIQKIDPSPFSLIKMVKLLPNH